MFKVAIIINLFCLLSCGVQKSGDINLNNMLIPNFNNQFEKFDIDEFEENSSNGVSIVKDDNYYIENLLQSTGYATVIYMNNSYVYLQKHFYPSGNIKSKGLMLVNGYPIETWYYFNQAGELTKEENMDEGYDFGWKSVIDYCEKNKIELPKGYVKGGFQTTIYKQESEGKKIWQVTHRFDTDKLQEIYLNGTNGNVIDKKIIAYKNN